MEVGEQHLTPGRIAWILVSHKQVVMEYKDKAPDSFDESALSDLDNGDPISPITRRKYPSARPTVKKVATATAIATGFESDDSMADSENDSDGYVAPMSTRKTRKRADSDGEYLPYKVRK